MAAALVQLLAGPAGAVHDAAAETLAALQAGSGEARRLVAQHARTLQLAP
jgi:hypothetical protein